MANIPKWLLNVNNKMISICGLPLMVQVLVISEPVKPYFFNEDFVIWLVNLKAKSQPRVARFRNSPPNSKI